MIRRNWLPYLLLRVACIVMLLGTTLYLVIAWKRIPDVVPSHYDLSGTIDGWSGKASLWVVLGMAWFMYLMFTAIEYIPQIWNVGVTVTPQNQSRVYDIVYRMMLMLKVWLVLLFCVITVISSNSLPLSPVFMIMILAVITLTLLVHLIQLWLAR